MKIIPYPETRQVFSFDCGANALVSVLVFAGLEEREDRIAVLAGTTKTGTSTEGILRVLRYYGLPFRAHQRMRADDLRRAVDGGHPTLVTLQAYRESNRPYRKLWDDGHWVDCILLPEGGTLDFDEMDELNAMAISVHSPLGKAIVVAKPGETLQIQTPGGIQQIRVLEV